MLKMRVKSYASAAGGSNIVKYKNVYVSLADVNNTDAPSWPAALPSREPAAFYHLSFTIHSFCCLLFRSVLPDDRSMTHLSGRAEFAHPFLILF